MVAKGPFFRNQFVCSLSGNKSKLEESSIADYCFPWYVSHIDGVGQQFLERVGF
jgi:hypothetical protein